MNLAPLGARADDQPPGPGVARISLIQGDVGVRKDDAGETVAAALNAPLLEGEYLSTGDQGSDAELQVDGATAIRIGYDTQLRLVKLDNGDRDAQVAQGTVEERVLPGGTPVAIDTPSITVRPLGKGAYRIGVADDGSSQITIRSGSAVIATPQGEQTVSAGHSVNATGTADKPVVEVVDAIPMDDFDHFNDTRDAAAQQSLQEHNLPPDLAFDDYDHYGQWVDDPTYGQVWAPTVDPGWAPYTNGNWVWEGGYGWTWVAYEPWGWGPYHYGRWFHSAVYGWCWYPPQAAVHVWSPALVAFVGFGGGSVGFASIGWVPLAPREAFYPWYGWSGGVFAASTSVNVVNVTNVYYVNRRWGRIVPIDRWQAGNFAHPARIVAADWQDAQAVHGALPVVPTAANLRYNSKALPARLTRAPIERPRLTALAPRVRTAPFEQVRSALQTHVESLGHGSPAASHAAAPGEGRPANANPAWDRFERARAGQGSGAPGNGTGNAPANTPGHGNAGNAAAGNGAAGNGPAGNAQGNPAQSPGKQRGTPAKGHKGKSAPKADDKKKS